MCSDCTKGHEGIQSSGRQQKNVDEITDPDTTRFDLKLIKPNNSRPTVLSTLPQRYEGARRSSAVTRASQTGTLSERVAEFGPTSQLVLTKEDRLQLIRMYGTFSLAYSTAVQPELEYFHHDGGYIAFRQKWGYTYALGDPVTAPEKTAALVDGFIKRYPKPCFCQASASTAELLQATGYYINEMGVDTRIDLPGYEFGGRQKEKLRYAGNWLARHGFSIREMEIDANNVEQVEAMSDAWRAIGVPSELAAK